MLNKISRRLNLIIILVIILIISFTSTTSKIYNAEKINSYKVDTTWITDKPIAHRGLHNKIYPENSMAAFNNAIKNGYPIELDVNFTKDMNVVVIHDSNLERLTGVSKKVKDVTYNELKNLKILNTEQSIPLFKDVLRLVDGKVPILIEIKGCENISALCCEVNNILQGYKGDYAIQSFDSSVITWYSKNVPEVKKGILINDINDEGSLKSYKKIISNTYDKADFISININSLEDKRIQDLRKTGYPIISWTIQSEDKKLKAKNYSDNYIFDNDKI